MRITSITLLLIVLLTGFSCQDNHSLDEEMSLVATDEEDPLTAKNLINKAIEKNGLQDFDSIAVAFSFRDKWYRYQRLNGEFNYERWWVDSLNGQRIRDVLGNDGLVRYVDGNEVELEAKKRDAYSNSVNSVIYFAFMPWALADPSVDARLTGIDTILGDPLLHLTINFKTQDEHDHSDDYEYWFSLEDYDIKYLAYAHPSGRAPRFREAYNSRWIEGFRVRDYRNYTTANKEDLHVELLAAHFNSQNLKLLSIIEHGDFQEEPVNDRKRPMALSWWDKYTYSNE